MLHQKDLCDFFPLLSILWLLLLSVSTSVEPVANNGCVGRVSDNVLLEDSELLQLPLVFLADIFFSELLNNPKFKLEIERKIEPLQMQQHSLSTSLSIQTQQRTTPSMHTVTTIGADISITHSTPASTISLLNQHAYSKSRMEEANVVA
jgi:hypothetical protein